MRPNDTDPEEALDQFLTLPLVEEGWSPDTGYVILVLDRNDDDGLHKLLEIAQAHRMNGEIRLRPGFLHKGELRQTIHLESADRVQPPL